MTPATPHLPISIIGWFFLSWILATGLLIWPADSLNDYLRWLIFIGAIWLYFTILASGSHCYFLSPLFLAGAVTIVFYSIGPFLYSAIFPDSIPYYTSRSPTSAHALAISYIGSNAERLILQFSAFCFLILSVIIKWHIQTKPPPKTSATSYPRYLIGLFHILVLGFAILFIMNRWSSFGQAILSSGLGSEARHALAPLMSISITALAYFSARERTALKWAGALSMVVALISMIVSGLAATALYTVLVAILLFLLSAKIKPKNLLPVIGMAALVIPAVILVTGISRGEVKNAESTVTEYAVAKLLSKLIFRQTTSGACLNEVYEKYPSSESTNPLFFTMAIVPRALWPEKPSLSRESEYAEKYCGQTGAIKGSHSESITLLGEPLLNGGILGVIVAQLCLAVFFFIATNLLASGKPAQTILVVALLPWLATFEQHFGVYFANLVKTMIIMLPLFLVLIYSLWRHRKTLTGKF